MALKRNKIVYNSSETIENNSGEYLCEIGTFLPLRTRLRQLQESGKDLLAYRKAMADFENGTQNLNLDDYDDDTYSADELDMLVLEQRYLDVFNAQNKAREVKHNSNNANTENAIKEDVETEKELKTED